MNTLMIVQNAISPSSTPLLVQEYRVFVLIWFALLAFRFGLVP